MSGFSIYLNILEHFFENKYNFLNNLKIQGSLMIFFTSDTHLGHHNIIKYCDRPFANTEEMDETIINNWNSVIGPCDTVYHLGDFAFKDPLSYFKRLKGNIILIRGNHDYRWSNLSFFKSVHDLLQISVENTTIMLCHYAMRVWSKSHFGSWHLYGHSHGTLQAYDKSYDVGVDTNNFTPVSFETLKDIMKKNPDNLNWLKKLKGFDQKEFDEAKKLIDQGIDLD